MTAPRRRTIAGVGAVGVVATLAAATAVIAAITVTAALARPATYALPPESSTFKQTDDPGHAKAETWCSTCHSRDYVTTQPRGKGKDFWTASVNKMVTVYGAPIPEADRPLIAAYLAANY
jgi:mono/diheme cytochrome c family protein